LAGDTMTYDPSKTDEQIVNRWLGPITAWPDSGIAPTCPDCGQSTWIELGGGPAHDTYHPNVDIRPLPGVDVVSDLEKSPLPFHDEHADRIKMIHVINHLRADTAVRVLKDCLRILRPGGSLFIMVTDIEFVMKRILEDGMRDCWLTCIYGTRGNTYEADFHYWGYTQESLSMLLKTIGFTDVKLCGHMNPWEFRIEARK
jgi:SAM-dependent methyltransferase